METETGEIIETQLKSSAEEVREDLFVFEIHSSSLAQSSMQVEMEPKSIIAEPAEPQSAPKTEAPTSVEGSASSAAATVNYCVSLF